MCDQQQSIGRVSEKNEMEHESNFTNKKQQAIT